MIEFSLVNCASHKMKKRELDEALTYSIQYGKRLQLQGGLTEVITITT